MPARPCRLAPLAVLTRSRPPILRASASPSDSNRLGLARARHADCHGRFFAPYTRIPFGRVDSLRRARAVQLTWRAVAWRGVASPAAVGVHYTAELQSPCGPTRCGVVLPLCVRYPFAVFGSPVRAVGWTYGRDSFTRADLSQTAATGPRTNASASPAHPAQPCHSLTAPRGSLSKPRPTSQMLR